MTTNGYPVGKSWVSLESLNRISSLSFLIGIAFLCFVIGFSGWIKSKKKLLWCGHFDSWWFYISPNNDYNVEFTNFF